MPILAIVGVRPQFIKIGALFAAMPSEAIQIIHTGQHYDDDLSTVFFRDFGLPDPIYNFAVHEDSSLRRLSLTLSSLETVFRAAPAPMTILVVGDADPAYAGAIAAATAGWPLAHVEAGLRSNDANQPEQRNRRCIDSLAQFHFAPTRACIENLRTENITSAQLSGDLHLDAVLRMKARVLSSRPKSRDFGLDEGTYVFATFHRVSTLTSIEALRAVITALGTCGHPVLCALHPGAARALREFELLDEFCAYQNVCIVGPQAFEATLSLVHHSRTVVTDSGGLQRDCYYLQRRCVILRETTEFPETLHDDNGVLVGCDASRIRQAIRDFSTNPPAVSVDLDQFGGGHAATSIARSLLGLL